MMQLLRRLALVAGLAVMLAPVARAATNDVFDIALEHHWVVELGGQRFGLIEFDSPMTTVLLGGFYFDVPVPAIVVLVPLAAVPVLGAIGVIMQGRRRRYGFYR